MKTISIILFLIFSVLITKAQVSFGDPIKINDSWKFKLGDTKDASQVGFNDGKWRELNLPHDWSVKGKCQQITQRQ